MGTKYGQLDMDEKTYRPSTTLVEHNKFDKVFNEVIAKREATGLGWTAPANPEQEHDHDTQD